MKLKEIFHECREVEVDNKKIYLNTTAWYDYAHQIIIIILTAENVNLYVIDAFSRKLAFPVINSRANDPTRLAARIADMYYANVRGGWRGERIGEPTIMHQLNAEKILNGEGLDA